VKAYLARKREARGRILEKLTLDEAVGIILALLESNPATIIIDGLDECDPTKRQDLLNSLGKIIQESHNVIKVFLSSRDDHDLVRHLKRLPNLYIHAKDNEEDIRRFVQSRVEEAIRKGRLLCGEVPGSLKSTIVQTLIQKAEGMFRLVSLHIDSLCDPIRIKTKSNVLDALSKLPRDLKRSYDTVMTQISNSQDPNPMLAARAMKWLLCAQESLGSKDFILAICAHISTILSHSEILGICCNMVVYDEFTDKFRFSHLSVPEYLADLDEYSQARANAFVAEQCLYWICSIRPWDVTASLAGGETRIETHAPNSISINKYVDYY